MSKKQTKGMIILEINVRRCTRSDSFNLFVGAPQCLHGVVLDMEYERCCEIELIKNHKKDISDQQENRNLNNKLLPSFSEGPDAHFFHRINVHSLKQADMKSSGVEHEHGDNGVLGVTKR